MGSGTLVFREPFLTATLADASPVFLVYLDQTLIKEVAMAIFWEINAVATQLKSFDLGDKQDEDSLLIITGTKT